MNQLPYGHTRNVSLARGILGMLWRTTAHTVPPMVAWAVRVWKNPRARQMATLIMLLVGLLVQLGLVLLAGYLVDLSLSLMDLWVELARKHLELTM